MAGEVEGTQVRKSGFMQRAASTGLHKWGSAGRQTADGGESNTGTAGDGEVQEAGEVEGTQVRKSGFMQRAASTGLQKGSNAASPSAAGKAGDDGEVQEGDEVEGAQVRKSGFTQRVASPGRAWGSRPNVVWNRNSSSPAVKKD
jgi:ribosomal protein L34